MITGTGLNCQLICSLCPISDLRLDTLSQILTMSNVRAHCRMLVVESCQGMVVGALLDRMGGMCLYQFILTYFWYSIREGNTFILLIKYKGCSRKTLTLCFDNVDRHSVVCVGKAKYI